MAYVQAAFWFFMLGNKHLSPAAALVLVQTLADVVPAGGGFRDEEVRGVKDSASWARVRLCGGNNQENIHAPHPHAFAFFLRLRPIDKSVTDR